MDAKDRQRQNPPPMDPYDLGGKFIDHLIAGHYAAAADFFDERMRTTIPVASLKDTWRRAEVKFGKVQTRVEKQRYRHEQWDVVDVAVKFARGSVVFSFWISEGKISGFGAVE